jgi:hypothetical protein
VFSQDVKKNLKQLLIFLMFVTFLVSLSTGIIKFPEFQHYFIFVYSHISPAKISLIHDISGLTLIGLIIIHLVIKRKGLKIFVVLGSLLIVAIAGLMFYSYKNQPVNLATVQIQDYQGEKLGSINDFRENSIKGPQYINKNTYSLKITGLISEPKTYSYNDILKLTHYQKTVTINCVEGWSVKALWEGVLIKDLLKNLTIKPEAKTVIFYAVDGYSTSFPLDYVLTNNIMMADKMNGVILPPERGFPFQLVAEQKWGYKWIKWITKIELSSDTNYKGFWESRGYNNNGDLNGSKFSQ